MIPKIIHYCWFGGNPLPPLAQKCIKSWKKYCPDYQIIEWNESNFDVNCNAYCAAMYEQKKWAFLTDYVRLKVVYENGGVYMDTDVELLKPLDDLLNNKAYMGFETTGKVNTGLGFGAEKNHSFIKENMDVYEKMTGFDRVEICPVITTRIFEQYVIDCKSDKIQNVANVTIYPPEYFCAKHTHTGFIHVTKNTLSIHHFDASWNTSEEKKETEKRWKYYKKQRFRQMPKVIFRKIVGDRTVDKIKRYLHLK